MPSFHFPSLLTGMVGGALVLFLISGSLPSLRSPQPTNGMQRREGQWPRGGSGTVRAGSGAVSQPDAGSGVTVPLPSSSSAFSKPAV